MTTPRIVTEAEAAAQARWEQGDQSYAVAFALVGWALLPWALALWLLSEGYRRWAR